MRRKSTQLISSIVLLSLSISACGGTASTAPVGEAGTIAAVTLQALTEQSAPQQSLDAPPVADTPQPAALPTDAAIPPTAAPTSVPMTYLVPVAPKGSFIPYQADQCELIRSDFENAIGAPVVIESAPFSDRVTGGTGTACRIHATGNGLSYDMGGPYGTLVQLLTSQNWTEDSLNYGAGGPTGMATGFRRFGSLGLLSVTWRPSEDASCPTDQPIGACDLLPEQKLFDVTFDIADVVVYTPPASDMCANWLAALQPAIPIPFALETAYFTDFEQNRGTACQLRAEGNGNNFANIVDPSRALDALLTPLGWTLVNGADGPTGTGREYTNGNLVAIVFVKWKPSADANCPKDQPISACSLTPEQRLYTVTVAFGEK